MHVNFSFDSTRFRFISFREKHNGLFEAFLGVAFEVRDTKGSSLGSLHATGFGLEPQLAVDEAIARLEAQIILENNKSETRGPSRGIASEAEDLFNLLEI